MDCNDKGPVRLILDGIDITCSSSAPIYIKNAKRTILVLAEGSENSVMDAQSYSRRYSGDDNTEDGEEEKPNATIFSKDDLTPCGDGALTVEAKGEDGITSKDGLVLAGGIITVNAVDDGIRGKDYLVVRDGYITVTTEGDGLRSNNDTDETKGYVLIEGGDLYITSEGDTMTAETGILIADGTIDLFSGGGSSKRIDDDTSAKGLKSATGIIIDGRTVTIDSADGNDLVTFAPDHNYSAVTFSCPNLVVGSTYSIYTGGSSTGTVTDGLYRDGAYTAGTQVTQFTITGMVTRVSSSTNNPGDPGEPDDPGGSDRPRRF